MKKDPSVVLRFPVRLTDGPAPLAYVAYPNLEASLYARSLASAKPKLQKAVQRDVDAALLQVTNYQQGMIGCKDGTVLMVQFRYGNWGYEIGGPGRQHFSGCSGESEFNSACQAAVRHAEQSYGGVAWSVGVSGSFAKEAA